MAFGGVRLDDVAPDRAAYQALTAKEVKDAFAACFAPKHAIVVVVLPKTASAPGGAGAGMESGSGR